MAFRTKYLIAFNQGFWFFHFLQALFQCVGLLISSVIPVPWMVIAGWWFLGSIILKCIETVVWVRFKSHLKFHIIAIFSQEIRYICLLCNFHPFRVNKFIHILFWLPISHINCKSLLLNYFLSIHHVFIVHLWLWHSRMKLSIKSNKELTDTVINVSSLYFGWAIEWKWSFKCKSSLDIINEFKHKIFFIFNVLEFFGCHL